MGDAVPLAGDMIADAFASAQIRVADGAVSGMFGRSTIHSFDLPNVGWMDFELDMAGTFIGKFG